jgi:hypothetical protein
LDFLNDYKERHPIGRRIIESKLSFSFPGKVDCKKNSNCSENAIQSLLDVAHGVVVIRSKWRGSVEILLDLKFGAFGKCRC